VVVVKQSEAFSRSDPTSVHSPNADIAPQLPTVLGATKNHIIEMRLDINSTGCAGVRGRGSCMTKAWNLGRVCGWTEASGEV
jgi:hypothetical protein